jgi:hypothetical protein
MEDLFELVAASFIRNGIECPAGDPSSRWTSPAVPSSSVLPEHSFRKKPEPEIAT